MLLDMAASAYDNRTALGHGADGISYESLRRTVAGGAGVIRASAAGSVAFIGLNGPAFPCAAHGLRGRGCAVQPAELPAEQGTAWPSCWPGWTARWSSCDEALEDAVDASTIR